MTSCDLAIIGAGAAGLMAGIFAARSAPPGTKVVLLDGAKKPGAKILIAGGGRCNVTHDVVASADYFGGASNNTVKKILKSFSVKETTAFFKGLGVELKREDTGKLFPTTDKARTVLDALLKALADAGGELRAGHRVTKLDRTPSGFEITTNHGILLSPRVVLATGGKALPSSGSDGLGYRFARDMGHTVTQTWPALVPLVLQDGHWLTTLSGVALDVELTLSGKSGKTLYKQAGAMLATHFGVSGPAAMDMSRHLRDYPEQAPRRLTASLLPGESFERVEAWLMDAVREAPTVVVSTPLKRRLPDRLVEVMLRWEVGVKADLPLARLPKDDRRALCHALTGLHLPVVGDRGFTYAEVTAGGVPMAQVQTATMASKACAGLYLCGEVLDVDGRIGGYNFQWAWCTGRLAGLAAAAI
ncbi:MAG: aminoacetone oxidase family FAD-binding enzyme [Planctomycetota bacterium]